MAAAERNSRLNAGILWLPAQTLLHTARPCNGRSQGSLRRGPLSPSIGEPGTRHSGPAGQQPQKSSSCRKNATSGAIRRDLERSGPRCSRPGVTANFVAGTPLAMFVIKDTADLLLAWGIVHTMTHEAHPIEIKHGNRVFPSLP